MSVSIRYRMLSSFSCGASITTNPIEKGEFGKILSSDPDLKIHVTHRKLLLACNI